MALPDTNKGVGTRKTTNVIEIEWSGPFFSDGLAELNGPGDKGLLQVYGTHPVFGQDSLLYIDATGAGTFSTALERISRWVSCLPSQVSFYVGRLGSAQPLDIEEWEKDLAAAQRLLEFFHSPPWNSKAINHHGVTESTLVLNLGQRHRMSLEVSTMWDESMWAPGEVVWKPYRSGDGESDS